MVDSRNEGASSEHASGGPTTLFARLRQGLARRWAEYVLAVIIASAAALSALWAWTVPALQYPDEDSHIDYAFSIYSAGRLLNMRRAPSRWNTHPRVEGADFERISHLYTLHLIDGADFQRLRYHPHERAAPDYGTPAYYQRLARAAPREPAGPEDLGPGDNPWLVTAYPFGYYALVAAWLTLLSLFDEGPVVLFFGARALSVVLLCLSLVLVYATARQLRLGKWRSLALTAAIGFFPLTTFVSSAVQPDNLALTLSLLCFYLALKMRGRPGGRRLLAALAVALGALLVTKYQFYLFTALAVAGTVAGEHLFRRRPLRELLHDLTVLVLPSALFFAVQMWVVWGGPQITGSNLRLTARGQLTLLRDAVVDYYMGGLAFVSWWGQFGWMDTQLIIGSPQIQIRLNYLLLLLSLTVGALTLLRLEQVCTRLAVLARRGCARWALRAALSNPLLNSHLLFSAFMILLYTLTDNAFFAQGRHWFPYILSSFLIATQYAPRALTHRRTQAAFSALLVFCLLLYSAVGSYYSFRSVRERYYGAPAAARGADGAAQKVSPRGPR
jgi:hypothetical protein